MLYLQFERDEFNQIWNFLQNPYNPFRPSLSGKSLVETSSALEQLTQGLSQWQRKRRITRISRKFLVYGVVYAVGFAVVFCVLFFFSPAPVSQLSGLGRCFSCWCLCLVFCFFLLRLSVIHLVIFCLNFFHWQRTTLLLFGGGVIITREGFF